MGSALYRIREFRRLHAGHHYRDIGDRAVVAFGHRVGAGAAIVDAADQMGLRVVHRGDPRRAESTLFDSLRELFHVERRTKKFLTKTKQSHSCPNGAVVRINQLR